MQMYSAQMQDLDWNDLRYVLVLSRTGRLAGAARQLRVNETTIARRVARLEKALGSRLFERVNGVLVVTEIGQVAVQHAERIEVDIGEVKNAATGADAKAAGRVCITTIPMLLNRILVPALPGLLEAHPLLQLQLVADPRNLSLINREADVALRPARPEKEHRAVARRVGEIAYSVYGPSAARSRALPWITYESSMSALPHVSWMAKAIKEESEAGMSLLVNDSDVAVHAIRAGLGRSLLPCCIGDREEGLSRLSSRKPVLSRELWLLVHPELRHLGRIKATIGWIERVITELNG
jgi:DNA-binding transcriptional LysR family regulator